MMEMCLVGKKVYEAILQIAPWLRPAVGTPKKFFIFTSDGASSFSGCRNHPRKKKTDRSVR